MAMMNPLDVVRGWWIVAERATDWVAFNVAHLFQAAAHHPGALLSGQTWPPYSWHDWQAIPYAGILGRLGNGSPESVVAGHILWYGHRGLLALALFAVLVRLKGYRALWLLFVGVLVLAWRIMSAPFRIGRRKPSRVKVEERDIEGGARWATDDELHAYRKRDDAMPLRLGRACGLDGKPHGPMLYLDKKRATQSVLMIAPPGAGKSAYWISALLDIERTTKDSPSLFLWDVKGELAARTAAQLRRAGYKTLELDPFGEKGRINPMVWLTSPRWIDVFMTAWLANTESGVGGNSDDTHEGWSRQIITAAILAMRSRHGDAATLPAVFRALDGDPKDVYTLLAEADDEGAGAQTWKRLMNGPDGTFLRQRHSLRTRGAAFTEPAVRRFVSGHDLSLDQLLTRQGKPLAVYYQIPSATQQLVLPLTAAIVALLFAKIAAYGNRRGLERGLLALFDEAGSGAVIPSLPQGLDTLRGAGVAQVIVVQRLGQLVEKYGKVGAAGIKGSCGTWVTLGGISPEDADEVLRRIGERLLREERTTLQRAGDDPEEGRLHSADRAKPLLTQVQLAQLPPSVHLVVPRDRPPLLTYNKPYWEDRRLKRRASADDGETRKEEQPAATATTTQATQQKAATAIRDYY